MPKILLIHNDDSILLQLQKMLAGEGVEVKTADTLKMGNKLMETDHNIDLLVVGAKWPSDDLSIFLNGFKNAQRYLYIPILMISGSLDSRDIVKYSQQGVRDFIFWPTTGPTLTAKIKKAVENGKPTALIVDDDDVILDLLSNILELERFNILKASSGEEALAHLDQYNVDVVISDILMPEMTGIELMGEIKSRFGQLPVILITGFAGNYTSEDVLAAGADGYFSKPFKNTELVRKLRMVVNKYRRDRRKAETPVAETS